MLRWRYTTEGAALSLKYDVPCPVCREDVGKSCRTLTTKRVTDTHPARIRAAYPGNVIAAWSTEGERRVRS